MDLFWKLTSISIYNIVDRNILLTSKREQIDDSVQKVFEWGISPRSSTAMNPGDGSSMTVWLLLACEACLEVPCSAICLPRDSTMKRVPAASAELLRPDSVAEM